MNPSPISFRQATLADVPAMARSRVASEWAGGADETVMHRYLTGVHHPQQALAPRAAFVALEEERVVGFVAGHCTRRFGCDGELQWLLVLPERRGAGIADALVGELAHWFVAHDARRICVNVESGNARARAFYARHGARELSEHWLEWIDIAMVTTSRGGKRDGTPS